MDVNYMSFKNTQTGRSLFLSILINFPFIECLVMIIREFANPTLLFFYLVQLWQVGDNQDKDPPIV